ncbi:peptidase M48 Ste24p [Catenulispora acidiphila DSM 44928]|uniref:Peptidase M48 Ste24p n=1 Tax=Catenulispora acidiphila (strain DSM 44928 / JCM 14897 / NBRC 102108 / NRRL B-24433 / ID139908) TaxID=479433 RepID=C7PYW0_CATAD|nr:M48 family metalloprotease [Catenulispora acidiphila]ACU69516.1 peptidase M48 Ste24p [Catenulispora acidiphila DSM 44928]
MSSSLSDRRTDARFRADRNLSARMLSVMVLLAAVYGAAILLMIRFMGRAWPLGLAVVVAFAVFQILTSGKVAMRTMGAREVSAEEEPELHALVDRLCALSGMKKPTIAVAESRIPNACAVGRSKGGATLCVTRSLLDTLDPPELEGVIAHEMAHIEHGDAAVMTVAAFVGVLAGLVARVGLRFIYIGGRARGLWHIIVAAIGLIALATATWFVSLVLTRSLSRYREFAADRSAAQLTGNPSALASALAKVEAKVHGGGGIPQTDLRKAGALNAFYFAPVTSAKTTAHHLLSTHPTTQARLDRLVKMSTEMSKNG